MKATRKHDNKQLDISIVKERGKIIYICEGYRYFQFEFNKLFKDIQI
jgi:hypothetical protein